ncbi:MAG: zinc ABC transporter substrate-binding protein [Lentimicrobium sp.]|jgi:zinc transport system substrate-binding protein|nr:zinc ABC transporter substrate-binding protein [Lentimicrobium sp.]
MKTIHSLPFIFIAITVLSSCNSTQDKSTDKKILTVSIQPQKTILSRISGDKFTINVLIPEEGNHETYEPTAQQMVETGKSVAYFKLGHLDFEVNWLGKLTGNYPEMQIFDTSEGLDLIYGEEEVHGDHVHHGGIDPHIWLSVQAVKIQATNMLKSLKVLDTPNSAYYETNYNKFSSELDSLDQQIKKIIENSGTREFMIFHPSLGYFARDYQLNQIPIELEGKEPSPAYMKQLIDQAHEKQIKAIFVSSQFNTQSAMTIAGQLKANVVEFNPVDPNWEENMLYIANKIAGTNN